MAANPERGIENDPEPLGVAFLRGPSCTSMISFTSSHIPDQFSQNEALRTRSENGDQFSVFDSTHIIIKFYLLALI